MSMNNEYSPGTFSRHPEPFDLFVTSVKKEHGLVKIYGQQDYKTGRVVHKYLNAVADQLEGGSPPDLDKVIINQSVIARFDKCWYRANVLAINGQKYTMYFMDYGNVSDVGLADIRIGLHSQLDQIHPLAYPFYLAEVIPPGRDWSKPSMEFIDDALLNTISRCIVMNRTKGYCFLRIFKRDSHDTLINDLVQTGMAVLGVPNMDHLASLEPRQQPGPGGRPGYQPPGYLPMMPPNTMGPPSPNFPSSLSPQPPHFPTQRVSPQPRHSFPPPGPPPIQPVLPNHHSHLQPSHRLNQSHPRPLMHPNHPSDMPGIRINRDNVSRQQHSRTNHIQNQPMGRGSLVPGRSSGPNQDRTARFRPMQLEENEWHDVVLSSTDGGPADFCIQLKSSSKRLEDVMEAISKRSSLIPMNSNEIESGKPCLAMSKSDGAIYRAVILKKDNHFAKVYLLDYGITENLPTEQIYNISEEHIKPRILSVRCRLHQWQDLPPHSKAIAKNRLDQFADRQLKCKIVTSESDRQGSSFLTNTEVQLLDESGKDIGAEIKIFLSRKSQETEAASSGQPSYAFTDLHNRASVYLSFPGTGPGLFFVQLADCMDTLEPVMDNLAKLMKSPRPLVSPTPGMPCAAKYEDGVWYRAVVEEVYRQQSKMQVYFVDYGNSETVNNNFVSSIPERLVSVLPAQAVRCRLAGACEKLDSVPHLAQEAFQDIVTSETLLTVNVERKNKNLNYVQISTTTKPVLNVNQEIAKVLRDPMATKNASVSSGDERGRKMEGWDREVKRGEGHVRGGVYKKDGYGGRKEGWENSGKKEREAHRENIGFKYDYELEAGSASPNRSQSDEKENRRQNHVQDKNGWNSQVDFKAGIKRGDDLRISLRERRAEREVSAPSSNSIVSFRHQNINEGWRGKGKVTWVVNPSHFYIQLGNSSRFDDLMASIQNKFRSHQANADMKPWGKGSPVVARWNDEWYRGRVNFQKGNSVEVFFVDYGNVDKVPFSDVASLPEEFAELEVQGVRVGLAGVKPKDGSWDKFPSDGRYFDENFNDIEVVKSIGRDLFIKINNGNVRNLMIKDGLAIDEGNGVAEGGRSGWKQQERRDEGHMRGVVKKDGWRKDDGFGKGNGRKEGWEREGNGRKEGWERDGGGRKEGWDKRGDSRRQPEGFNKNKSEPSESWDSAPKGDKNNTKNKDDSRVFKIGSFPTMDVSPLMGKVVSGVVSHVNSGSEFWVQFNESKVNRVSAMLENPGTKTVTPSVGLAVVAQYDGAWYRGIIEAIESEKVKVHFVDYGNTELLNKEEIIECGKDLLEAPLGAVKCKLQKERQNFEDLLGSSDYVIKVKVKSFSMGQFVLELMDGKERDKKWEGVADKREKDIRSVPFPPGENVAVTVVHVENIDKVWVVPITVQEQLDKLMGELAECGEGLKLLTKVKVGTLGATRYSEDGELYRARVLKVKDDMCEVQYIDYGNGEEVEIQNMFALPNSLAEVSPAARSMKVAATRFALDNENNRNALLEALSAEDVKVKMANLMATFSVNGEELKMNKIVKVVEGNLFETASCPRVVCSVTYVEVSGVWLLANDLLEKLDAMMKSLQSAPKNKPKNVKVGSWVAGKFSQDRQIYRAKITKILPEDKLELHYIDYGNRETVKLGDVWELAEEFCLHPGYAMRVELDATGDSKVLGQSEMNMVVTEQKTVTAELVQPRQAIVRLYLDGERISYQPGTEALETGLSPARLRLGAERIGIVVESVDNVMAVQDLEAAAKVEDVMEVIEKDMEELKGVPEVGKVYVLKEGSRRIIITGIKDEVASALLVETQEKIELRLPALLFVCPARAMALPPAAMSTAPLVTSTKDRFPLPGRLVGLSVEDNSLKIRENRFRIAVDFSPRSELLITFSGSISASLSLMLPLLPANGTSWSPEVLHTIREYIMGNKLNIFFNQNNVARISAVDCNEAPLVDKLIDSGVAKANTELVEDVSKDDDYCTHTVFLGSAETDEMLEEVHQEVGGETSEILVAVNSQLPKLKLTTLRQKVIVVKLEGDSAWIRPESEDLDKTWSELTDQLSEIAPGGSLTTTLTPGAVCLYTGEDDMCLRALVVFVKEDSVGLALIDLGDTVLCGISEVVDLPKQLAGFPPMTVLAGLQKQGSCELEDGDTAEGTMAVENGKLVFSITAS